MNRKPSYDFYLILATTGILFIISVICIYAMFYFKIAHIHQSPALIKIQYMERMNSVISPFLIGLIILLGICVPKRLFSTSLLNKFAVLLLIIVAAVSLLFGLKMGLLLLLLIALFLQTAVLFLAITGSIHLKFEKKGYWIRLGSSLIHMGLILFILDLFLYQYVTIHLILFWITTTTCVLGMTFCFFSDPVTKLLSLFSGKKNQENRILNP